MDVFHATVVFAWPDCSCKLCGQPDTHLYEIYSRSQTDIPRAMQCGNSEWQVDDRHREHYP